VVKRGVDILLSSGILLAASPLLLLTALAIWISSPGPILFRQSRMGRGFVSFEILKFRTMAHGEAGLAYTLGPDPRITRFGRWLRRTKVDELPQLWNVLRGDMSLVGPRPVIPELALEFGVHYKLLLRARPGLTDPASLKYSQETRLLASSSDPMRFFKSVVTPDKIQISLEYMDSANAWTDGVTMALTAAICCFPAMSTMYGQLPNPTATFGPLRPEQDRHAAQPVSQTQLARPVQAVQPVQAPRPLRPAAYNGAVFSHRLALLEAEKAIDPGFLPWNRLQISLSGSQSTPRIAQEEASGL